MCNDIKNSYNELFDAVLKLETNEDCEAFFLDLCSESELNAMTQRIKAAKLLKKGFTYEQIIKETEISSTTLSRISRCVKNGNGYKKFL